MRQQKWIFCLGLMALIVWLMPGDSSAGVPPQQTAAGEKNQPVALPAAPFPQGAEAKAQETTGGEDINQQLLEAAENGDTAAIEASLARGASVNAKDKEGNSALRLAARGGDADAVRGLLARGADVNVAALNGGTALTAAAFGGHRDLVEALLAAGADKQALQATRTSQAIARKPEINVSFEERLLGTMPPDDESPAFAGLIQLKASETTRGKVEVQLKVGPPAVMCFPASRQDYEFSTVVEGLKKKNEASLSLGFVGNSVARLPHANRAAQLDNPEQWTFLGSQHGKVFVVVNQKKGPEFDEVGMPFMSPDLGAIGYIAVERDTAVTKAFLVLGNKAVPLQQGEAIELRNSDQQYSPPRFSPDNRRLAYISWQEQKKKQGVAVIEGNWRDPAPAEVKYGPRFDSAWDPVFSPDGGIIAYSAKEGKKQFMVIGDNRGPQFDSVGHLVFSPDGTTVAYWAHQNNKSFIIVGEKKGAEYDKAGGPIFSPDGRTVSYWASKSGKEFVVIGNKEGPGFDNALEPVFSPDGRLVAYPVRQGEKMFIVVGENKGPSFDAVGEPVFSPDGSIVAYWAKHAKKWFVVVGDKHGPEFDRAASDPIFSPDGRALAYEAGEQGKEFIVVGEKRGPEFDLVFHPHFSSDSGKVAYGAQQGRESWWKITSIR